MTAAFATGPLATFGTAWACVLATWAFWATFVTAVGKALPRASLGILTSFAWTLRIWRKDRLRGRSKVGESFATCMETIAMSS